MENRHELVVAKVAAFVYVEIDEPTEKGGREFSTPNELFRYLDYLQRGQRILFDLGFVLYPEVGVEYRTKLELYDGTFGYDIGVSAGCKVGDLRYGIPCTTCHQMTWWQKDYSRSQKATCADCSDRERWHDVPDEIENFDNEY